MLSQRCEHSPVCSRGREGLRHTLYAPELIHIHQHTTGSQMDRHGDKRECTVERGQSVQSTEMSSNIEMMRGASFKLRLKSHVGNQTGQPSVTSSVYDLFSMQQSGRTKTLLPVIDQGKESCAVEKFSSSG